LHNNVQIQTPKLNKLGDVEISHLLIQLQSFSTLISPQNLSRHVPQESLENTKSLILTVKKEQQLYFFHRVCKSNKSIFKSHKHSGAFTSLRLDVSPTLKTVD